MGDRATYTWEEILITVKAYPNPSTRYVESSCTAGMTRSGEWVRLYPLPYRMLDSDRKFKKYQWIRAKIKKSSDPRPESHNIDIDSIQVLDESLSLTHNWAQRRAFLEPFRRPSMEEIWAEQERTGISLSFFRPRQIDSLVIEPAAAEWTPRQLAALRQQNFFDKYEQAPLEKVPFDFSYRFHCDDRRCNGHQARIVDWEIYQSYRRWRRQYGEDWEEKLRQRYEKEMQETKDTHFFVGTMRAHPKQWIVIGLFYPPKVEAWQATLL